MLRNQISIARRRLRSLSPWVNLGFKKVSSFVLSSLLFPSLERKPNLSVIPHISPFIWNERIRSPNQMFYLIEVSDLLSYDLLSYAAGSLRHHLQMPPLRFW